MFPEPCIAIAGFLEAICPTLPLKPSVWPDESQGILQRQRKKWWQQKVEVKWSLHLPPFTKTGNRDLGLSNQGEQSDGELASRRVTLILAGLAVGWGVASYVSMTYGILVSWPDYVHTNFGLPFAFAIHTSNTIAGPVDVWDVNVEALAADLAFWLIGLIALTLATLARNPRAGVPAALTAN